MLGADADRLAESKREGLQPSALTRIPLGLVRGNDHRRLAGTEPPRDFLVERGQPGAPVDQEQGDIRLANRRLGLLTHPAWQRMRILIFVTRCIHYPEFEAEKLGIPLAPVASHARAIVDQRQPLSDQTVEQRRLAHIGASDDRDDRQAGHDGGG